MDSPVHRVTMLLGYRAEKSLAVQGGPRMCCIFLLFFEGFRMLNAHLP